MTNDLKEACPGCSDWLMCYAQADRDLRECRQALDAEARTIRDLRAENESLLQECMTLRIAMREKST
jgi:hypothetical protein